MAQEKLVIYPWTMSMTGDWDPESGLYELRDAKVSELVDMLWKPGSYVQNSALVELIVHGNARRAAEVARGLIQKYPVTEVTIREGLGILATDLLETPLEQLPGGIADYDPNKIELVQ